MKRKDSGRATGCSQAGPPEADRDCPHSARQDGAGGSFTSDHIAPGSARSLRARALAWLAQREHSRSELQRKLLRLPDAEPAAVEALLDELTLKGYLNEARFVESRLHVRSPRLGSLRIRQELAQHGLKMNEAQAAALKATELSRASEVRARRFGPDAPKDAADWAKQARFLSGRGFAPDVISRVLREPSSD